MAIAQAYGNQALLVESLTTLGAARHRVGQPAAAEQLYRQALELALRTEDRAAAAALRNNLGLLRLERGDPEQAEALFRQALALNEALGDGAGAASNHVNLGLAAERRQAYDAAEGEYLQALESDKAAERQPEIAADLLRLGRVAGRQGFHDRTLDYSKRAYRSYSAQGNLLHARSALAQAMEAAERLGRKEEVLRLERELNGPAAVSRPR